TSDPEHHRDRSEPAEDAADADRVADRLAEAVLRRNPEVDERGVVPADLDLVDHVVGAVESGATIEVRLDGRACARHLVRLAGDGHGGLEAVGLYVVQGDPA